MKKKNIISSVFIALLLTVLWFYINWDLSKEVNQVDIDEIDNATTTPFLIDSISIEIEDEGDVTIEVIETDDLQNLQEKPAIIKPIPDLDREIVFKEGFSADAQQLIIDDIEKISRELKDDPTFFGNWLYLGLNREAIGDYEGARQVWEYAKLVRSNNFVVRGNLGDLYAYYLKDNQKAEENYLKALELGPRQTYLYFKTAEFYRDFLLDNQKAKETVQTGLINNPTSQDLKNLLNSL